MPEAESLRTHTGKAVSWFNLCWSKARHVSEYSRSLAFHFELLEMMPLHWRLNFLLVLANTGVVYFLVFVMPREKEKAESLRQ